MALAVTCLARHLRLSQGVRFEEPQLQEVYMATVPGPRPDGPLPRPGAPAEEPPYEREEEDQREASPERTDDPWTPAPYDPEREYAEPASPVGVP